MTKDETIDKLWEQSNHGTRREDVVATWEAGAAAEREACAKLIDKIGYSHTAGLSQFVSGEFAKAADAIRMRSNAALRGDSGLIAGVPLESTVMRGGSND